MSPKVSIIIPVYNTEPYLRECLDSIVNQTLHEIQVICVNDGSTDRSLDILNEYAEKDSRIEIIDKTNGGLSSARNTGVSRVRGKYILFVDSDDWIENDTAQQAFSVAEGKNAELVLFEYSRKRLNALRNFSESLKEPYSLDDRNYLINRSASSACVKLYQAEFYKKNNIDFPLGLINEDEYTHRLCLLLVNKIAFFSQKTLYHYRIHSGSIMQSRGKRLADIIDSWIGLNSDCSNQTSTGHTKITIFGPDSLSCEIIIGKFQWN